MRYSFDQFELDVELHRLVDADGREITLRPQAFKVLAYLVDRAPSVVSRDELLEGVWGHNALSVSGVAQAIREIRRALQDDASQPGIVATRHGCGYQIVAAVIARNPSPKGDAGPVDPAAERMHSPLATMAIFGLLLIGVVAGSYWFTPVSGVARPVDGQSGVLARLGQDSLPEGFEARAALAQGVTAMSEMDWMRASERFNASLGFDSGSVAARLGLVDALLRAGYEARARDLINHPVLQLGNLSRRGRLEVRAQLARLSGDWNEVVNCMRSLAEFFPTQLEYHFGLFEALLASAPPAHARDALERLRRMLPQDAPGARYYLALHALHLRESQEADALAAARLALHNAKFTGDSALSAHAELALGRSLSRIDHSVEAGEAFVRAAEAMRAGQNEFGRAVTQLELARLELRQDRLQKVRPLMDPSCEVLGAIGSTLGMARCIRLEGELMAAQGEHESAESLLEQAVVGFERVGSLVEAADGYLEMGRLYLGTGNLDEAEDSILRAGDLFERIGDRAGYAWVRHVNGLILQQRGMIVEARIAHGDAYIVFRGLADRAGEAAAARGMAAALNLEGQLARASELLDEAIFIHRELDDRRELAETLFDAGTLAERSGQLASAEQHFEEAADLFLGSGRFERATLAFAELSRVFIDQARAGPARAALEEASALRPKDVGVLASLNSVSGYLALLECDRDQAERLFTAARALRGSGGENSPDLRSQLDHARLYIELGQSDRAEAAARHIVEHIDQSNENALVAKGFVVLVESLQIQGRANEARQELLRMERLGLVNANFKVELAYKILLGKLDMVADPSAHLRIVRQRANETGYRLLALETDVALASKLLGNGQMGEGRELARTVMRQGRQTGMLYVAERAMRLNEPQANISMTD